MMQMKKTAQMEMIGLVLVVFLLSIGMFFLISVSNKENIDARAVNPQDVDLAQNMIDAIKYVKLDCPPIQGKKVGIDDLIADMVLDNRITCQGKRSEDYLRIAISNILNATLGNHSKSYSFIIIRNEGRNDEKKYLPISNYNCTTSSEGKSGSQPFPLRGGAGVVTMKLFICK